MWRRACAIFFVLVLIIQIGAFAQWGNTKNENLFKQSFAQTDSTAISQDQINGVLDTLSSLGFTVTKGIGICPDPGYSTVSNGANYFLISSNKTDGTPGGKIIIACLALWPTTDLANQMYQNTYNNELNPGQYEVYFSGTPQIEKFDASGHAAFNWIIPNDRTKHRLELPTVWYPIGEATAVSTCGNIFLYTTYDSISAKSYAEIGQAAGSSTAAQAAATNATVSQLRLDAKSSATDWVSKLVQSLSSANLCNVTPTHLPIIFLPGVGGTYLYSIGTHWNSQTWPRAGTDAKYMFLQSDGITPVDPSYQINATQIFSVKYTPFNFYGSFEDYLGTKGYKLGTDLFDFPYDWRLDNSIHLKELDQLVDTVRDKTHSDKVILMAHSMGGLIARAYVNSMGASKVDTLITIGTPFYGAVKPFYALVNGYTFDNPFATQLSFKYLAQNAPAVYQLSPRLPFILDTQTHDELTLDQSFQIKYKEVKPGYVTYRETLGNNWSPNPDLVNASDKFFGLLGTKDFPTPLPSGVKHYAIIGTGVSTLNRYYMYDQTDPNKSYVELLGRHVYLKPGFGDGDGTVPLWSSEISGVTSTYYIPYKKGIISDTTSEHGSLTKNPDVQTIVGSILDHKPIDPSTYSYNANDLVKKDSTDFTLHSNADLTVLDEQSGTKLGFNDQGGMDESIPTGTFLSMDGGTYVHIDDTSDTYKVILNGTSSGNFTLITNVTKSGQSTIFSYKDVPVQQGTIAQVEMTPAQISSSSIPTMQVNTNGQTTTVSATSGASSVSPSPSTPQQTTSQSSTPGQAQSFAQIPYVVKGFLSGNSIVVNNQNTNSQLANYVVMQTVPDKYAQQVLGISEQYVTTLAYEDRYGRAESNNNLNVFLQVSHTNDKINSMRGVELGGDSIMTSLPSMSSSTMLVNSAEIKIPQGTAGNIPQKVRDTLNAAVEPADTPKPVADFLDNNIDLQNKATNDHLTHYILVQTVPDLYAQKVLGIQGQYVTTLAFEDRYGRQDSNGNLNVFLQLSHTADHVNSIRAIQLGGDNIEAFVNGVDEGSITKTTEIPMSSGAVTAPQSSSTPSNPNSVNSPTQPNPLSSQSLAPAAQSSAGSFQMDKPVYSSSANPSELATISGKVNSHNGGHVVFTITKLDGSKQEIDAPVTSVGFFTTLIIIDSSYPPGTYAISGNYQGSDLGSMTFIVR